MVKTRKAPSTPSSDMKRERQHSTSSQQNNLEETSTRIKKMSVSEDNDSPAIRQRTLSGSQRSPKVSRTRTASQSSQGHPSPKTERKTVSSLDGKTVDSPKLQRKRTASGSSDRRDKKEHSSLTYRMHRIRFFDYEPQAINCIACDEKNNRLALSRSDGSIEIWSFGDEKPDLFQQMVIRTESGTSIEALLWHNGVLLRGGLDGDLVEYDMTTLKAKACIPCHAGAIWCLVLSKCTNYIAAGTEEGCVVIFEHTGDGFRYLKSLQKQEERMLAIDWNESGEAIVTGGIDNIRLWSVESGHAAQRITIARQSPDKETIVWAVALLKDMTIVSGDSRGKVTFWSGLTGTQIKMFGCHRADILSLVVSPDETKVYAAGIDPTVVQFELAPVSAASDWMVWQRGSVRAHHTHDVRSVVMLNGYVITGGVDCSLVAANFEEKVKYKTIPLPHHTLVHVAKQAKTVLLQYTSHIQLWTLGTTNTEVANRAVDSDLLPLSDSPVNMLELRTRNEEHIVCSSISQDGQWLAYADRNTVRIFNLSLSQSEMLAPRITACRLKGLPTSLSQLPVRSMKFTSGDKLILGYVDGSVKLLELKTNNSLPQINMILSSTPVKDAGVAYILQVSSDGSKIAVSDDKYNTIVYTVTTDKDIKMLCRLPRKESFVTAMAFSPDREKLALSYSLARKRIMEYDLVRRCYTGQATDTVLKHSKEKQFNTFGVVSKVLNIQYAKHNSNCILVQDAHCIKIYNTATCKMSTVNNMYENRYLMHFEEMDDDFALVVERSPLSLSNALPQALSRKQFGT